MTGKVLFALGLLTVAFSGCVSDNSHPSPSSSGPSAPVVGEDTGAVEGTVTTDELEPISGAYVGAEGSGAESVQTDADGHFSISQLLPGPHTIFVNAIGYMAAAKQAQIAAAEVTEVQFALEPLSVADPYSVVEHRDGFISCGSGSAVVTQVTCGQVDNNQKFMFNYSVDKRMSGILFEMAWKPSQALSKDLVLIAEKSGCGFTCGADDTFAEKSGCCYLRIGLTQDQLTKPAGDKPATDFTDHNGQIQTRTFPSFGESTVPATVFTSQTFRIYVEYFFNGLPTDFETRTNVASG